MRDETSAGFDVFIFFLYTFHNEATVVLLLHVINCFIE